MPNSLQQNRKKFSSLQANSSGASSLQPLSSLLQGSSLNQGSNIRDFIKNLPQAPQSRPNGQAPISKPSVNVPSGNAAATSPARQQFVQKAIQTPQQAEPRTPSGLTLAQAEAAQAANQQAPIQATAQPTLSVPVAPAAVKEPASNSQALKDFIATLAKSQGERELEERLANVQTGTESSIRDIGQQPIANRFITGQQRAVEERGLGQASVLQRELERLTGARQDESALQKFLLEREDAAAATTAESAQTSREEAESLRRFGITQGNVEASRGIGQEQFAQTQQLAQDKFNEDVRQFSVTLAQKKAETAAATASGRTVINEFGSNIQATQPVKPAIGGEDKAFTFFSRMNNAVKNLDDLEKTLTGLSFVQQLNLKFGGPLTQGQELERIAQAQREFTEARLRKDSGAAIPPQEFDNDKQTYFPQPGDSPEVLVQKKQARVIALGAIRLESGNAYHEFFGEAPTVVGQRLLKEAQGQSQIGSFTNSRGETFNLPN